MRTGTRLGLLVAALVGGAASLAAGLDGSPRPLAIRGGTASFTVDAQLALSSLASLGDAHLQKLADMLSLLAGTEEARSADWERIRAPLAAAAPLNVPAVLWFALPNGTYWTVAKGRAAGHLSDRPYFPRVIAGRTVIGDLVVSHSTNRNTAIVAVPVRGSDGKVVGVLGGSVHLDSLGVLLRRELGGLDPGYLFFAIDAQPLGALNSDPALIFTEPMKLGDEGMRRAFQEMLAGRDGVVEYTFRGSPRTVLYHHSPVTGWWYGFGMLRQASGSAPLP